MEHGRMTQASLFPAGARRSASPDAVARLIRALRGRGWVRRRVLQRELLISERRFRTIAHASRGQIIGSDKGYRLTLEANPDDLRAATGRIRAQIAQEQQRLLDIERVWHARKVTAA